MLFRKLALSTLLMSALVAHAFSPQSGTWVVDSELDGKPGRGLAIDVQNDVFVMQMYAYENSGQPTFYLATGKVVNGQVTAALNRYVGGRFLGSGPLSGSLAGSPGTASFRFTSGITGFVQLPGEPEKAISRFNFGYPFAAQSLVGLWSFLSLGSDGLAADAVQLSTNIGPTSNGNGVVVNSDSTFGCEHQVRGSLAGFVLCVKMNQQGQLLRSYRYVYSVNDGEGYSQRNGGTDQTMSVRRHTSPQGVGTGLAFKVDSTAPEHEALRNHIDAIAATSTVSQ